MSLNSTSSRAAEDERPLEEQLAAARALVARLLSERTRILDVLVDLVNASAKYRHTWVTIKGEPDLRVAWEKANAMCVTWARCAPERTAQLQAVARQLPGAPLAEQK